jgi:hypothetical protein
MKLIIGLIISAISFAADKIYLDAEEPGEGFKIKNFATERALQEKCPILYEEYKKMTSKGTVLIIGAWDTELEILKNYFNSPSPHTFKVELGEFGHDHFLELVSRYEIKELQQAPLYEKIIKDRIKNEKNKKKSELLYAENTVKEYILKKPKHIQHLWGLLASKYWLLRETPNKAPKLFDGYQLASLDSIKSLASSLDMQNVEGAYKIENTLWLRTKNYLYKCIPGKEKLIEVAALWLPKTKINESDKFSYQSFVVTSDETFIFMLYSAGYSGLRLLDGKTYVLLADVRLSENVSPDLYLQNNEKLWFSKENDNTPHYSLSIRRFYKLQKVYNSLPAKKLLEYLALPHFMVNTIE